MRDHYGMKKRRVIFTGPLGLAQTGASNKTLRAMIKQHRAGEIKIHKIVDFKIGDLTVVHQFIGWKEAA